MGYAAVLLPTLFFLMWNPQLFRAEGKIPKRTYVLFALFAALSAIDFAVSWKWGLQYQGPQYTAIVFSIASILSLLVFLLLGSAGLARMFERIPPKYNDALVGFVIAGVGLYILLAG